MPMKCPLTLIAVLGILAITPLPALAEKKTYIPNTLSPFWMGASQASAGVSCYAYLNDMITKDEAAQLISNDYYSAIQIEIDSKKISMNTHLDFSGSYIAWFRDTLSRGGCESLKDQNFSVDGPRE